MQRNDSLIDEDLTDCGTVDINYIAVSDEEVFFEDKIGVPLRNCAYHFLYVVSFLVPTKVVIAPTYQTIAK